MRGSLPDISPSSGAYRATSPPKGKAFPGEVGLSWFKKDKSGFEEEVVVWI